jgi:hypothetical protein
MIKAGSFYGTDSMIIVPALLTAVLPLSDPIPC